MNTRNRYWATNRVSHCTPECCTCPNNSRVHLNTCSAGAGNTDTVCHNDAHTDAVKSVYFGHICTHFCTEDGCVNVIASDPMDESGRYEVVLESFRHHTGEGCISPRCYCQEATQR